MANTGQLGFNVGGQGNLWYFDDTYGELVPTIGGSSTYDLGRGFGLNGYRFLLNEKAPLGTFIWTLGDGDAVTAAEETTLLGGNLAFRGPLSSYPTYQSVPSAYINVVGRTLWFKARGVLDSSASPATASDTVKFKLGTDIALSTGVRAMAVIASGPVPWFFEGELKVITTGATGTLIGQGKFTYWTADAATSVDWAAYATTITADLTVAKTIDLTNTWSTTDDADTITCQQLLVGFSN